MALDSSKLEVEKAYKIRDFVLYELTSPTRSARVLVPAVAGVKVGDIIQKDGSKATLMPDVYGIALENADSVLLPGLTQYGDLKIAALSGYGGYAEVKRLPHWTDAQVKGLEALGYKIIQQGK